MPFSLSHTSDLVKTYLGVRLISHFLLHKGKVQVLLRQCSMCQKIYSFVSLNIHSVYTCQSTPVNSSCLYKLTDANVIWLMVVGERVYIYSLHSHDKIGVWTLTSTYTCTFTLYSAISSSHLHKNIDMRVCLSVRDIVKVFRCTHAQPVWRKFAQKTY